MSSAPRNHRNHGSAGKRSPQRFDGVLRYLRYPRATFRVCGDGKCSRWRCSGRAMLRELALQPYDGGMEITVQFLGRPRFVSLRLTTTKPLPRRLMPTTTVLCLWPLLLPLMLLLLLLLLCRLLLLLLLLLLCRYHIQAVPLCSVLAMCQCRLARAHAICLRRGRSRPD